MQSTELFKSTVETIVLKILQDHGKMYGYEITQRVKELSEGRILLSEGALYPLLHKLEDDGILKTVSTKVGNRTRKYYSLTPSGRIQARDLVAEFLEFFKAMTVVLQVKVS